MVGQVCINLQLPRFLFSLLLVSYSPRLQRLMASRLTSASAYVKDFLRMVADGCVEELPIRQLH